MTAPPKPSAAFGRWRNEVVRLGPDRNKASTKQAELDRQLRETTKGSNSDRSNP